MNITQQEIIEYFNMKIRRNPVIDQGGLLDNDGKIIFEAEKDFGTSDLPAIIEYLTLLRIEDSKTAVANAVSNSAASSGGASKSFNKAFIEDVLTIQPKWLGGINLRDTDLYYVRNDDIVIKSPVDTGSGVVLELLGESFADDIDDLNIGYGKLVLERVVVWVSIVTGKLYRHF